jgi:MFS family permease
MQTSRQMQFHVESMRAPSREEVEEPVTYVDREHTTYQYAVIMAAFSMCITVDILQYSMPLAFLPSVLEDRGHKVENIATAIGIYYWAGFLGGLSVTTYEVWKAFYLKEEHGAHGLTLYSTAKRHIKFLVFGLGIGVATLFIQALSPRWQTHVICRFIQGFAGAYIFFYVFLLNVAVFKGQQQVTAMTCASCATVVAELAGPLLGSLLFDQFGQRATFWFLGFVSLINQGMLVLALYTIKHTEGLESPTASPAISPALPDETDAQTKAWWTPQPGAWPKMKALFQNPTFICANLIILMAGMIKGSVEEMLPFHADHQWHYDPVMIGQLFCTVAVAYLAAAGLVCQFWIALGRFQIGFSAQSIFLLGVTAWMSFCVADYTKNSKVLYCTFGSYGFAAGLAFTAAAQLIAAVVDSQEGHRKDAANGIWNTVWEAGGSTGFALGGLLAHHHEDQMGLTGKFAICAFVIAGCMLAVGGVSKDSSLLAAGKVDKAADYGSTA